MSICGERFVRHSPTNYILLHSYCILRKPLIIANSNQKDFHEGDICDFPLAEIHLDYALIDYDERKLVNHTDAHVWLHSQHKLVKT